MKKIFLLSAFAALTATVTLNAQDDKDTRIEGSGKVVTKEISIQSFDQLDVSGVCNVILTQGSKEEVKIEADDNLQELFIVKNEGSTLSISMKKHSNINTKTKIKVYISFKKLKSMDLKTVGNVSSDQNMSFDDLNINNKSVGSVNLKLTAQSLNIDNKSVGDVTLNGKADKVTIHSNGVGGIQASNFIVQAMDIENTGVGGAEVNAEKELKVRDSFLGKVINKGNATAKRMNRVTI